MNPTMTEPHPELEDFTHDQLPGRPRRTLLTKLTVPPLALLLVAAGFVGGIRLEKSRTSGSSATSGLSASSSAASGSTSRQFGPGASRTTGKHSIAGKSGSSKSGSPTAGAPSGSAVPSSGSFGGGTTGTISSISGNSIVLKTTSGNSIKVKLTSATTLKKNLHVKRNSIRPGDTITVTGITAKNGSMKASSISDTGASSSTSSSGSGSSSSSSSSSGS